MQPEPTTLPVTVTKDGVCVVDGYGIELRVERGHLVIADGLGRFRRSGRFARATCALRRLVVIGHTGFVTLEAIRWLEGVGTQFVHLGADGQVLLTSSSFGLDDPRLRRAQALALGTPHGNEIARSILRRKLDGQSRIADELGRPDVQAVIETCRAELDRAKTPAQLLVPEAAAADAYWSAWAGLELRWALRDEGRIPVHWRTFGTRASPLTGNPRLAANPANALLNLGYGITEGEARLVCLAVGLDPGLGVLHADQQARDSLALDLLEAVRSEVDGLVLRLLRGRNFRAADFFEDRRGVVRVLAPLSHELARGAVTLGRVIAPVAEEVVRALAEAPTSRIRARLATPLTQANRSAGRGGIRRRGPRPKSPEVPVRQRTCLSCGGPVRGPRRYCDDCRPDFVTFQAVGSNALAEARAKGRDPAHGGEVADIRGEKLVERRKLEREWESMNGPADPEVFRVEILPVLRNLPTRRLVEATGLTRAYCSRIRKGEFIPHPRWWEKLKGV